MNRNYKDPICSRVAIAPLENRVWLYARTAPDESGLIIEQIQLLRQQAIKNGLTVVGASQDTASGLSLDRPGLQKMLQAVWDERAGAVMVKSVSRLGRSTDALIKVFQVLNKHHVRLLCQDNNFKDLFKSDEYKRLLELGKQLRREHVK